MGIEWIEGGGATSPKGFRAGGVYAGIKGYGPEPRLDVGILASDRDCAAAGVFTRNRMCGAPVVVTRERVMTGTARAIVANSGNSNVATGEAGLRAAEQMAALAAGKIGIPPEHMLVASTGVIGRPLPLDRIEAGVSQIELGDSAEAGLAFARAIMTTDTVPKRRAGTVTAGGRTYTIGGVAKGAGMAHPDMATVFCFLTTDAPAHPAWLRTTLSKAADVSLNMLDIDSDTSTSDMMLVLANGAAGGAPISAGHPAADALAGAIEEISIALARDLARDGEGATTLIEALVSGAQDVEDARRAARTIVSSPLVKTMVAGRDPNPGRVLMAVGRSGATFAHAGLMVWIGERCVFRSGAPADVDYAAVKQAMDVPELRIVVDLGVGSARATAWGCDLTEEYVRINARYTT